MKTSDFAYHLTPDRIAQRPLDIRDASRLLVLHRPDGRLEHRRFHDLGDYLRPGDILVANDSRVIPARLYGRKEPGGGRVELLLLQQLDELRWQALVGGRRLVEGVRVRLEHHDGRPSPLHATVTAVLPGSLREIKFDEPILDSLAGLGRVPLPPYIHHALNEPERYQTVYARPPGSAAAPTAGLHFTAELLLSLRESGVFFETATLHVGLDTFQPIVAPTVEQHTIHSEWATLSPDAARRINEAKLAGGRLIAVGTTSMRLLETAALRSAGVTGSLQTISRRDAAGETTVICPWQPVASFTGPTDLFIYPGYRFRAVDALITNFHLPHSTLLILVSAFAGCQQVRHAYDTAVAEAYRFYSFGDAMLIL